MQTNNQTEGKRGGKILTMKTPERERDEALLSVELAARRKDAFAAELIKCLTTTFQVPLQNALAINKRCHDASLRVE